jgi:hypothetical protein
VETAPSKDRNRGQLGDNLKVVQAEFLSVSLRVTNLANYLSIRLLLEAHCDCYDKVAQRNGLLFAETNILHYHLNKQFQNMVCSRYIKVSKVVCCRCFGLSN